MERHNGAPNRSSRSSDDPSPQTGHDADTSQEPQTLTSADGRRTSRSERGATRRSRARTMNRIGDRRSVQHRSERSGTWPEIRRAPTRLDKPRRSSHTHDDTHDDARAPRPSDPRADSKGRAPSLRSVTQADDHQLESLQLAPHQPRRHLELIGDLGVRTPTQHRQQHPLTNPIRKPNTSHHNTSQKRQVLQPPQEPKQAPSGTVRVEGPGGGR